MNFELFKKVTKNVNGKVRGININELPELHSEFRALREDFNNFTYQICPEKLNPHKIRNQWQNSGNFNKYFWNQFILKDKTIDEHNGVLIWMGIDANGIKLQFGTTENFQSNRAKENKFIFERHGLEVDEIFYKNGIRDNAILEKFQKNERLDNAYDKHAALNYHYLGDNVEGDIEYFKIILTELGEQLLKYIEDREHINEVEINIENLDKAIAEYSLEKDVEHFFLIDGGTRLYPRRYIVNEAAKLQGILKSYTTNEAKTILEKVYGNRVEFISYLKQKDDEKKMDIKNIVLYGSPGVGKTHNVNKLISMIEEGKTHQDIFESIQENTNEKVNLDANLSKRVKFITFHQSFGYEDFIEGFRPDEKGEIQLEDGIFKTIARDASENKKVVSSEHITFEDAYDILRMSFVDEILEPLNTVTSKEIEVKDIQDKFLKVKTTGAKNEHYIKKSDLEIVVDGVIHNIVERPVDIKKLEVKKDTIALAGYYYPVAIRIVDIIKENKIELESEKNFYLVIDEINRGNISKIFGELITLIEESKRDTLEVQLPYSKKAFKVPSNLYIIGTMNSTDKSIALIDIALRRRFTFLKMEPNPELVPMFAREIFRILNERIKKDLGSDYLLGHSYFMNIDRGELDLVLKYKIEPLLEEYYYGNKEGFENIMGLFPNKSIKTEGTESE